MRGGPLELHNQTGFEYTCRVYLTTGRPPVAARQLNARREKSSLSKTSYRKYHRLG